MIEVDAMPRYRFTVRRMMVAVAIIALFSWTDRMIVKHRFYRDRCRLHAEEAEIWLRSQGELLQLCGMLTHTRDELEQMKAEKHGRDVERVAYHSDLRRKYDYAARYPWMPVAPDPPEPE